MLVADRELGADLVVDGLRDQHAAGLGHALEACRHVHALAEQVAPVDHHVAQMDADAEPHRAGLVPPAMAGGELALDLDRALHRLDDAREVGEQPVAGRVGDPAAMALDEPGEHAAAVLQRRHRRDLVGLHEAAVALDVGRQDGGQLAFDSGGHGRRLSMGARRA